jgi:catechol 2,3-dioxygenase-like lactoylglutathione lyase family enzyme
METPIRESEGVLAMQVCFVTDDLDRSLAYFADIIGQPVPTINQQPPIDVARPRYLGQTSKLGFRQAMFSWRGTLIEFIEPDDEPSTWRDFLDRKGPSVHHLGFTVANFDATQDELSQMGMPVLQDGFFPGGRYAFTDSEQELGVVIELLELDSSWRSEADRLTIPTEAN